MSQSFEWSEDFSVNDDAIDSFHKQILGLMRDLEQYMSQASYGADFSATLCNLASVCKEHFNAEEAYIGNNCPWLLLDHKTKHAHILESLERYQMGYLDSGKIDQSFRPFLLTWLKAHIVGNDKQYKNILNQRPKNKLTA